MSPALSYLEVFVTESTPKSRIKERHQAVYPVSNGEGYHSLNQCLDEIEKEMKDGRLTIMKTSEHYGRPSEIRA